MPLGVPWLRHNFHCYIFPLLISISNIVILCAKIFFVFFLWKKRKRKRYYNRTTTPNITANKSVFVVLYYLDRHSGGMMKRVKNIRDPFLSASTYLCPLITMVTNEKKLSTLPVSAVRPISKTISCTADARSSTAIKKNRSTVRNAGHGAE